MIRLQGISKQYRTDTVATAALRGIDLEVARGEFTAIMGPSGCGKSTLLNLIGLLDAPDAGRLWLDDQEVGSLDESGRAALRKRHIGFIFQSFNLIEELTVAENIELALRYHGIAAAERRARVAEAMDQVGIAHRAGHRPSQLSGGQQQRVAVGRAVVARPALILADEPTGNLDSVNGEEVMRMLRALNEAGTTVLMVTHTPAHADHARRVIQLIDGQVVGDRRSAVAA
ncbi:ABC transporter ATP-binding protein [Piscinibacter sakaiensis]|uniref:ABC transporter ATP-binding protein n=1 Tax=Piscinibacter sakaiensis TaxID=1547922 RepID=A0A0K8P0A7_PISS1|nr:ABC transporter ATP-binding protein [Piscinibacter sakaiensis]GAP35605.1 ABC transporter ATP-binding protein [Piscinibacter sakaiensis]